MSQDVYARPMPRSVKRTPINMQLIANAPVEIAPASPGFQIIITAIRFTVDQSTTLQFFSGSNALSGPLMIAATSESGVFGGGTVGQFLSVFESNLNEDFQVVSSVNCQFSGWVDWYYGLSFAGP